MGRRRRASAWRYVVVGSLGLAACTAASCKLFDVAPPSPNADAGDGDAGPSPGDAGVVYPGFVSLESAIRACSRVTGCDATMAESLQQSLAISIDATNFTHCVDALAGPLDPDRLNEATSDRIECIASAKSCGAATACMLYQSDETTDPRCATLNKEANCVDDGGTALVCGGGTSLKIDCANPAFGPGASCQIFVLDDGREHALCVLSTPCAATETCRGTLFDGCVSGPKPGHQVIDCAPSGSRCVAAERGCAGARCIGPTATTCEATRMAVCGLGSVTNVDCAHIGATCIKSSTTVACARADDECNVFDEPRKDRCVDGATIGLCVGGKKTTFSCASVGMKCVPAAGIKSSYCAP